MKKKNIILVRGVLNGPKKFNSVKKRLDKYFNFYDFDPEYKKFSIEQASENLAEFIDKNNIKNYSFISFSLGGIVVRHFLGTKKIENIKIVLIGVPNNGSSLLAVTLKKIPFAKHIFGKSAVDFVENKKKILKHPKKCQYCVILGTKNFEWKIPESYISPLIWDTNASDGKVKIQEGRYKKEKFYLVDGYHSFLAEHPDTIKITKEFLV